MRRTPLARLDAALGPTASACSPNGRRSFGMEEFRNLTWIGSVSE